MDVKPAPDQKVGRREGASDTGTSFLDGKAQSQGLFWEPGSSDEMAGNRSESSSDLQCAQAHALVLYPKDTVGTSEATRLVMSRMEGSG